MGAAYFLVDTAQAAAEPPSRWLQAFPEGQWCDWATLGVVWREGDTVWLPAHRPDWEARLQAWHVAHPDAAVVVLSTDLQDEQGLRALQAGARGYAHLLAVPAVLREVAAVVIHGGLWVGPSLLQRLMRATQAALNRQIPRPAAELDLSALSVREVQVARAVAAGHSNKEVARQLDITERTVKAHLGAIFEKWGLRDRVQLVLRMNGPTLTP